MTSAYVSDVLRSLVNVSQVLNIDYLNFFESHLFEHKQLCKRPFTENDSKSKYRLKEVQQAFVEFSFVFQRLFLNFVS